MTARKPTAGFWITVALVAVLVVYPLSYGAWHYARGRLGATNETVRVWHRPFIPLGYFSDNGPRILTSRYRDFLIWCVRRGMDDAGDSKSHGRPKHSPRR